MINLSAAAACGTAVEAVQLPRQRAPRRRQGGALLEAKEIANVRAEPSTEAAQLGTIRVGETYRVIGRYVSLVAI